MDYVAFTLPVLNCSKVLSELAALKIVVFDAEIKGNDLSFRVKRNERQKIIAFFEKVCYDYRVQGEGGPLFGLRNFFRRKGLVAGILIVCALLWSVNSRLNEIRIHGLKTVDAAAVLALLESQGIKRGAHTGKIDKKHIEYLITSSIDGIAFASVRISGMTLILNLYEELPPPEIVDMSKTESILAKKSGIISRVIVFGGTPAVKAGEPVREGSELILPYTVAAEGLQVPARASGEVFAKVYYSGSASFIETTIMTVRTGKSKSVSRAEIFGFQIGKTSAPVSPYPLFEEEIDERYLFAAAPLKVTRYTYYELRAETVKKTFPEELSALIEQAKRNAEGGLPKDAAILDSWYVLRGGGTDGVRIVEYYFEVEEKIS
ncbi:MAG: sporulation protein YqfD [Clostridiales bacterium]|jgi:sporulation protein YqfD|nr:sporulation protein YqfD [Clostridiales bacterium]